MWFLDIPKKEEIEQQKQNEVQLLETCNLLEGKQIYKITINSPNSFYVSNVVKINENIAIMDKLSLPAGLMENAIKISNKVEIIYKEGLYKINIYGEENENGEIINPDVITKCFTTTSLTIEQNDNLCITYLNDQRSLISMWENLRKIFKPFSICLIGINIALVISILVALIPNKKER